MPIYMFIYTFKVITIDLVSLLLVKMMIYHLFYRDNYVRKNAKIC